jgi:Bacterial aa3 type cytochrome c oxidase subunit IV
VVSGRREQQPRRQKGSGMRIDRSEGHPAMDYAEHERTYKRFLKLTGYLIAGVVILMACLAIFVV